MKKLNGKIASATLVMTMLFSSIPSNVTSSDVIKAEVNNKEVTDISTSVDTVDVLNLSTVKDEYCVTYDYKTNGGISIDGNQENSKLLHKGDLVDLTLKGEKPSDSTSDKWEFLGWNTDPNATTVLSELKMEESDIILYAIYQKDITTKDNVDKQIDRTNISEANPLDNNITSASAATTEPEVSIVSSDGNTMDFTYTFHWDDYDDILGLRGCVNYIYISLSHYIPGNYSDTYKNFSEEIYMRDIDITSDSFTFTFEDMPIENDNGVAYKYDVYSYTVPYNYRHDDYYAREEGMDYYLGLYESISTLPDSGEDNELSITLDACRKDGTPATYDDYEQVPCDSNGVLLTLLQLKKKFVFEEDDIKEVYNFDKYQNRYNILLKPGEKTDIFYIPDGKYEVMFSNSSYCELLNLGSLEDEDTNVEMEQIDGKHYITFSAKTKNSKLDLNTKVSLNDWAGYCNNLHKIIPNIYYHEELRMPG